MGVVCVYPRTVTLPNYFFSSGKGGIHTNVRYGGIYIKSLVPGGAADQDGRIQIGNPFMSPKHSTSWDV